MLAKKKILAVIPARSGSKGLPGKNIKLLCGKPLLNHCVDLALGISLIDKVVVSTDSKKFAAIAKKAGARVPFLRPAHLSGDLVPDVPVIQHCLDWYKEHENYEPDIIVFLRPTGPMRKLEEVERAIRLLVANPEADSVLSIREADKTPYKMWVPGGKYLSPFITEYAGIKEPFNSPRQLLPKVYYSTPDIAVFWTKTLVKQKSVTGKKVLPLYIERPTIDIDTLHDFEIAEFILNKKGKR